MRHVFKAGWCALLSCGILFPIGLFAQSSSSNPMTDQQNTGKGLFLQNCSVCHLSKPVSKNAKKEGERIGPQLDLLTKGPGALPDSVLKSFIMNGSEGKMPAFKYGLEPKEIDAIIAYLRIM